MKSNLLKRIPVMGLLLMVQAAKAQNIEFFKGTWEAVLAKAKTEHKLVFVDMYADWCGPCQSMIKNVFTQAAVAGKFNSTFINFQVNVDKEEGTALVKQYKIYSIPAYLFVDASGKQVYKIDGAMPARKFIAGANKAQKLYEAK